MNVIFIVVDALRFDHLGKSGYNRDTSPNIDRIANESAFFTNSITAIPSSTPSVASMMTGLYPHSHGLRFILRHKLNPKITTLAEILQAHGYRTIGYDIDSMDSGIEKGFDEFSSLQWRIKNKIKRLIHKKEVTRAEELTDFAKSQIKKNKHKKFFLYLHYADLHTPYEPPKPFDEMFNPGYKGESVFDDWSDKKGDIVFNINLPKEKVHNAIAQYDGLIKFIDMQVSYIIKYIEELKLKDKTSIIITADHGEGLGEHGLSFQHSLCLYEEGIRIPLIIHAPKIQGKKIETQVQTIDIMPTILDILDIPLIEKVDGKSLVPIINEGEDDRKYLFAENGKMEFKQNNRTFFPGIKGKWRMIRTNEWKLIYIPHPENDIYELYNLKEDPKENVNLINKELGVAKELRGKLFEWMNHSKGDEDVDLTERSKKLLRKLGYMENKNV
tara:strand:- start:6799 stop:8124 length:1326 start_codon:yes stop_codon:yes gene_type:complete